MRALPQLGFYTSPAQTAPAVSPPFDCPCPVCAQPLMDADMRTVSLMPVGGTVSAFYRLHRTCAEALSGANASRLDEVALWIAETYAREAKA